MQLSLKATRLGLRNSTTRLPFRYGKACLTRCPQAVLQVTIEAAGRTQSGHSGDCLPPSWFDKTPGRDFAQQIEDMLMAIATAETVYAEEFSRPTTFFPAWLRAHERLQALTAARQRPTLLASFGSSLVERAILDALCRVAGTSFAQAVRTNLFAIEAAAVHPELSGLSSRDWLPIEARTAIFVRHTVGLIDPLTAADIPSSERLPDGFPQALEEYIQRCGLRYFKIKVSNVLDRDLDRLKQIAHLVERYRGAEYHVTLDGNEQYQSAEQFDVLIEAIRHDSALATLWDNVLVIEQPLERSIALEAAHTAGIRQLAKIKPVIIDESDGELTSYAQALELGYRGVSSKSCKGVIKSLLNAGLTWRRNDRGQCHDYLMTAEDLCTVGVVPVQSDLCLVATLGLSHIERNGHHYHRGLSYLPEPQQAAALAAHGDFYSRQQGVVAPRLVDGQFQIGSLQCAGFGFAVEPDLSSMQSPAEWQFASLGLADISV